MFSQQPANQKQYKNPAHANVVRITSKIKHTPMNKILSSATKMVLLAVSFTLCFSTIFGVVTRQVDFKDLITLFTSFVMAVSGFYFANKGNSNEEYLGK